MYIKRNQELKVKSSTCNKCNSNRLLYSKGKLICTNCGEVISTSYNKYNAIKTVAKDGLKRDSKFEANVADELLLRVKLGDIKAYDSQYRVDIPIYSKDGITVDTVRHKVDFRIHHNDGSFELYEAKGKETDDYKWRRRFLEKIWLDEHKDHIYSVIYQRKVPKRRKIA